MQYDSELAEIMNKYKPGSIAIEEEEEQQKMEEQKQIPEPKSVSSPALPLEPPVAQTSNGDGGVPATMPPQEAPTSEAKRPSDKEVLEVLKTRFEDLWRLEVEHETLKRDYSSLDQAKNEVEKQKAELQKKTEEQNHQIEDLRKALEEEKNKNVSLDKRLKEAEHKLEGEKERYALLSGQFEELNNKLVEIVTNVTHMKTDELAKLNKSPRRPSSETPTRPNQAIPPAGAGFSTFFSTTPTKPAAPGRK